MQGHISSDPYNGLQDGDIVIKKSQVDELLEKFKRALENENDFKSTHWTAAYDKGKLIGEVNAFKKALGIVGLGEHVSTIEAEIYSSGKKEAKG